MRRLNMSSDDVIRDRQLQRRLFFEKHHTKEKSSIHHNNINKEEKTIHHKEKEEPIILFTNAEVERMSKKVDDSLLLCARSFVPNDRASRVDDSLPPSFDIRSSKKVVIAHYNENTNWVHNLKYPYQIISRAGMRKETAPNKGNEASVFLEYILANYEKLSDFTIFVHAHRTSWHHPTNIDERLNTLQLTKPYYNFNELAVGSICIPSIPFTNMLIADGIIPAYPRPQKHIYRAGAQFYVHKSLILRNPKHVYQKYYDFLMNSSEKSAATGRYFEYSWHMIFTHELNDVE